MLIFLDTDERYLAPLWRCCNSGAVNKCHDLITTLLITVPFHHWRPFFLCRCRARLEQFACRYHIGPVAVSFQATAEDRTVPP